MRCGAIIRFSGDGVGRRLKAPSCARIAGIIILVSQDRTRQAGAVAAAQGDVCSGPRNPIGCKLRRAAKIHAAKIRALIPRILL